MCVCGSYETVNAFGIKSATETGVSISAIIASHRISIYYYYKMASTTSWTHLEVKYCAVWSLLHSSIVAKALAYDIAIALHMLCIYSCGGCGNYARIFRPVSIPFDGLPFAAARCEWHDTPNQSWVGIINAAHATQEKHCCCSQVKHFELFCLL